MQYRCLLEASVVVKTFRYAMGAIGTKVYGYYHKENCLGSISRLHGYLPPVREKILVVEIAEVQLIRVRDNEISRTPSWAYHCRNH